MPSRKFAVVDGVRMTAKTWPKRELPYCDRGRSKCTAESVTEDIAQLRQLVSECGLYAKTIGIVDSSLELRTIELVRV